MQVYPYKATYKLENGSYQVDRLGYLLFEVIERREILNDEGKKQVVYSNDSSIKIYLGATPITKLITVDVRNPATFNEEGEHFFAEKLHNDEIVGLQVVNGKEEGKFDFKFKTFENSEAAPQKKELTFTLTAKEFELLQSLL